MATPISAAYSQQSSSTQTGTTPAAPPAGDALANEQTFLTLLVSQIKYQDPLNPSDSMQYVTQLAQFSQLEQMLRIRTDADALTQQFVPATGPNGNTTSDDSSNGKTDGTTPS